ncbi:MAG: recF [Firmicutes bacterium]|nr:recF [Bacillota bacterium]
MSENGDGTTSTLESDIKVFACSLSYWEQYLSDKILTGSSINDSIINDAYSFLLEDIGLNPKKSIREEINFSCAVLNNSKFPSKLALKQLRDVTGVNALLDNQVIDFSDNVTVIFGKNGTGKTGYCRLLKKACFSRSIEDIINNIYTPTKTDTSAKFIFAQDGSDYFIEYPKEKDKPEFQQIAVFDSKSADVHLNNKNQFQFKPAGLKFFSELVKAFKQVEAKITLEINGLVDKNYAALFDGESEIKNLIQSLSYNTPIDEIKKHATFAETDKINKLQAEEQKTVLQTMKRDKEISDLKNTRASITNLISNINKINIFFIEESLATVKRDIEDYIDKSEMARQESIDSFATDVISNTGSQEWKKFIDAAHTFALTQDTGNYPTEGNYCLFCHQQLGRDALELINRYWIFIKSKAEQELKATQKELDKHKKDYAELSFYLIDEGSILEKWLVENYPGVLSCLRRQVHSTQLLCQDVINSIDNLNAQDLDKHEIKIESLQSIIATIDKQINELKDKEPNEKLEEINRTITYLVHKEKLNAHFAEIERYTIQLYQKHKLNEAKNQITTKKVTDKEKELSNKYFNQTYYDEFSKLCNELDGGFGVEIKHTGSEGISYRELKIKNRIPSEILSEGEQKVISIADFLSEVRISGINKAIVFDDPVNSLDEERKSSIAERLVREANERQLIIFTHDLAFVSCIIGSCSDIGMKCSCHWIEKINGQPGTIWLNNAPSYEKQYKNAEKAEKFCQEAAKKGPEERQSCIKNGFAALRTSYEALVIFELFCGVVQRFNERVSMESLKDVNFDKSLRDQIIESFSLCCRYMEGHSHSDKYTYIKPELDNLREEINRFSDIRKKIKDSKKS